MKRYLLDSNALNLLVHRRCGVYERSIAVRKMGHDVGTAIPVVAEILGGVELSASRDANLPIIERELKLLRLWPFDLPAARNYAEIHGVLRKQGILMQVIDQMIAAVAKAIPNCTVVSSDSDFSRVPGLRVETWAI